MIKRLYGIFLLSFLLLLSACHTTHHHFPSEDDGPPKVPVDVSKVPNAVPKLEALSRYGNPASYKALGKKYHVMHSSSGYKERGLASWYGTKFHRKRTSSGERYNMFGMTAAHRTLPIPCYVRVTNLQNGKQVIVKVNDRGPFRHNRLIDLSYAAAKKLEIFGRGTGFVEVAAVDPRNRYSAPSTVRITSMPRLYIQVGSFGDRRNAEKLALRIKRLTKQAIRLQLNRMGRGTVYRVQIGPFPNVASADATYSKIRVRGLGKPITVIQ